jgi:hypothetical protein
LHLKISALLGYID